MKRIFDKLKEYGLVSFATAAVLSVGAYSWKLVERNASVEAELKFREKYEKEELELRNKYENIIVDNIKLSMCCGK